MIYTVTAADGTTANYTVTVTVAASSGQVIITAYSLAGVLGTIDEMAKTIAVTMPFGTDVTTLVATFSTTGTWVGVSGFMQGSGITENNFTNPVIYTVTAEGATPSAYTVTVTVETSAVELPKTAQTVSYVAGDDGALQRGAAWPNTRFMVGTGAEAECITDNLTGLMWVRSPEDTYRTWQEGLDYANGLDLCGYTDWRMPNIKELKSLINYGQAFNTNWLNTQGFNFWNIQLLSNHYWSSTTYAPSKSYAWIILPIYDSSTSSKKIDGRYVLPVRTSNVGIINLPKTGQTLCYDTVGDQIACANSGQDGELQKGVTWPNPRFTANIDTTVTDNLTGLIWTLDADTPAFVGTATTCTGGTKTWQEALDYVACLNTNSYLGHNDWRLPNIKEIESMMNLNAVSGSFNLSWLYGLGFNITNNGVYWSSTTYPGGNGEGNYSFFIDMRLGPISVDLKTVTYYVWPVRLGQ